MEKLDKFSNLAIAMQSYDPETQRKVGEMAESVLFGHRSKNLAITDH